MRGRKRGGGDQSGFDAEKGTIDGRGWVEAAAATVQGGGKEKEANRTGPQEESEGERLRERKRVVRVRER